MPRKLSEIILAVAVTCFTFSSTVFAGKIGLATKLLLSERDRGTVSEGVAKVLVATETHIRLLARGDTNAIGRFAETHDGSAGAVAGDIIAISLPIDMIKTLAAETYVLRIEAEPRLEPCNDTSAALVGAIDVREGHAPLDTGYTGKGVIVGVIDTGIDFRHETFAVKDDQAKSCILSIWDQTATDGTPPEGYNYGAEWTREQIESDLGYGTQIVTQNDINGHGTHVAATAAGTGSPDGDYIGMAPDADIIFVAYRRMRELNTASNYIESVLSDIPSVLDGTKYIFDKADELNRPAVINISLSNNLTAHNGTSLLEQALDNLVQEKKGRVICAAAGNKRGENYHFGVDTLGNDPSWTYISVDPSRYSSVEVPYTVAYAAINTNDPDNMKLALGIDSYSEDGVVETLDQIPWLSIRELATMEDGYTYSYGELGDSFDVSVNLIAEESDTPGMYNLTIFTEDNLATDENSLFSNINPVRVMAKGNGSIHMWYLSGLSSDEIVDTFHLPEGQGYVAYDDNYMVGAPATAKHVIAVGGYYGTNSYVNSGYNLFSYSVQKGEISFFSSIGPSADGRVKPDITAPCLFVTSALSADSEETANRWQYIVDDDNKYIVMSGTSMATPIVSGSVALYLEKYPDASITQVREALFQSADTDEFTGTIPNNDYGYGKLNILSAITSNVANITSEDNLIPAAFEIRQNYPNPFNPTTTVPYSITCSGAVEISVYNVLGQEITTLVDSYHLPGNYVARWNGLNMNGIEVSGGVYYVKMKVGDTTLSRKMLLMK